MARHNSPILKHVFGWSTLEPRNFTHSYVPKRNEYMHPPKTMYKKIYGSFVHNSSKLETTQNNHDGRHKHMPTIEYSALLKKDWTIDTTAMWMNLKNMLSKIIQT